MTYNPHANQNTLPPDDIPPVIPPPSEPSGSHFWGYEYIEGILYKILLPPPDYNTKTFSEVLPPYNQYTRAQLGEMLDAVITERESEVQEMYDYQEEKAVLKAAGDEVNEARVQESIEALREEIAVKSALANALRDALDPPVVVPESQQFEQIHSNGSITYPPNESYLFAQGGDAQLALSSGYQVTLDHQGFIVDIWDPVTHNLYDALGNIIGHRDTPYRDPSGH